MHGYLLSHWWLWLIEDEGGLLCLGFLAFFGLCVCLICIVKHLKRDFEYLFPFNVLFVFAFCYFVVLSVHVAFREYESKTVWCLRFSEEQ